MSGGIYGVPASFPLSSKVLATDGSYAEVQKQLGNEIRGPQGKAYRLVQAATALTTTVRAKFLYYIDTSAFTVGLSGAGVAPAGVGLVDQESLAAGDLFWCQIEGEVTLTDDGGGDITKSSFIDTAATGDANKQATPAPYTTCAVNQGTATPAANAQFTAMLLYKLVGVGDA